MDALGSVAARTGAALFSGENADLRASFGHQMRDLLKSGVDAFGDDEEDLVVEAEEVPETVEDTVEDAVEDAGEAVEDTFEDAVGEAAEEAGDAAEDAAEEIEAPEKPLDEEIDLL